MKNQALQEVAFESMWDILNLFGSDVGNLRSLSFSLSRRSIGAELNAFLQTRVFEYSNIFFRETEFSDETYAVKVFNGLLPPEDAVNVLKNFADFQVEFSDILKVIILMKFELI